jgi:hypothetical protein
MVLERNNNNTQSKKISVTLAYKTYRIKMNGRSVFLAIVVSFASSADCFMNAAFTLAPVKGDLKTRLCTLHGPGSLFGNVREMKGNKNILKMGNDENRDSQPNAIMQYLEDIVDYLDQKGGYVITEQQLKSGLGDKDLQAMKQAFDRPKRKLAPRTITLFIVSLTALPLVLWFKFALDNPCAMLHLC